MRVSIDVSEKDQKILLALIDQYLPNTQIWAFGSRVKGNARPNSDLDLVVFTSFQQNRNLHDFNDALQESALPFRVDVLVWDNIPDNFRSIILQQYYELPLAIPETDFSGAPQLSV